ncbi:hypothetical protein UlMin_005031 [Ulmus minor]
MGNKTRQRKNDQVDKHKNIYDLSEDIMIKILSLVSGKTLQNLRCICKWWNKIISENKLIARNTLPFQPILLVQSKQSWKNKVLELDEKRLEVKLKNTNKFPAGKIRSSCNNFILHNNPNDIKGLLLTNAVTKFQVSLPHCPSDCPHRACGVALGFNPIEKNYTVVHIYADGFGLEIFNVGCSENKWKRIRGPIRERIQGEGDMFYWSDPISTKEQTLFYWHAGSNNHVISFNICDEKWRRIGLPGGESIYRRKYSLLEMGGDLCLMHKVSKSEFDIWILKDHEGQVWSKKLSVSSSMVDYLLRDPGNDRRNVLPDFDKLVPVVSLRSGEIIIFQHRTTSCGYVYDTKGMAFNKFNGLHKKEDYKFLIHESYSYTRSWIE